jgi:hypothetical protein
LPLLSAREKIQDAAIDRVSSASGVTSFDHTQGVFHRVARNPHVGQLQNVNDV